LLTGMADENGYDGSLLVEIIEAEGLSSMNAAVFGSVVGKSDDGDWKSLLEFKTTTVASYEPIWAEDFEVQLFGIDKLKLVLHVTDQKRKNKAFLGEIEINEFKFGERVSYDLDNGGKKAGKISIRVDYFPGAHQAPRKSYSDLKKEITQLRRELARLKK